MRDDYPKYQNFDRKHTMYNIIDQNLTYTF